MGARPPLVLTVDDIVKVFRNVSSELPRTQTMYPSYMRASITTRVAESIYRALKLDNVLRADERIVKAIIWLGVSSGLVVCSINNECRVGDKYCSLECAPHYMVAGAMAALRLLGVDIIEPPPEVVIAASYPNDRINIIKIYRAYHEIDEVIPVEDVAPHMMMS